MRCPMLIITEVKEKMYLSECSQLMPARPSVKGG
jgi:hypothetical protein